MPSRSDRTAAARWLNVLLKAKSADGWPHSLDMPIYFQALSRWAGRGQSQTDLMRVLQAMAERGDSSLEAFEQAQVAACSADPVTAGVREKWHVVIPFQIGFKGQVRPAISVFGQHFRFLSA